MTNHMIMMHPVLIDSLSFIFPIYSSAIGASVLTHAVTLYARQAFTDISERRLRTSIPRDDEAPRSKMSRGASAP